LLLPFPAGGPAHEEGGPVRVLFRPEAIEISDKEFSSQEAVVSVGESALVDRTFAGPLDRMRFEVATLQGSRPLKPSLHYGQRFPLVEVIKRSAAAHKSLPGDKVFLGISQYHILNPSGVRMLVVIDANNPESAASRIADVILLASHGIATLVAVVESTERRQECLARLNAVLAGMRSRTSSQIDLRIRVGQPTREIILEVQEQFYDFVIIAGANLASSEESAFEPIIRRLLVYSRIPVMLGMEAPPDLKKLMICTAAGAPGKGDIKLGGRLARHTQAISTVFHVLAKDAGEPWKQAVDRHMAQAQALLEAYGVRGETKVREGEWQKEIAQEAERENFDLILLGTSAGMNYGIADYGIELCLRTKKCVLLVPPEDVL
ncbi:MAG: universal stress protein, partial [Deltaproteobacteria bacterium]|nr:universal stress protein [Deltaproteobacteria bacterium]